MNISDITKQIQNLDITTSRQVNEIFSGNYKSSFRGQGIEVTNLRKYVEGDPYKNIDWQTTAKKGDIYIKEFQESRELTSMVIVDTSSSMNFTSTSRTKQSTAIQFAATILFSALKNGDKFGAIIFNNKTKIFIPPQKGKTHLLRILREIIFQYQNNQFTKANTAEALKYLNQVVKKHTICFLLTDELNPNSLSQLKIANNKHDLIFVNIFDNFERGINNNNYINIENPETKKQFYIDFNNQKTRDKFYQIRQKKYQQLKKNLIKNETDLIEISTQDNIYQKLLTFFKKRQLRH